MIPTLPACCTAPHFHWPLPVPLPDVLLCSTAFDPARLEPADFARSGIPPVRGVAKRQAEYLAGRLCAREALRRLSGLPAVPAVGEDRAPQWPAGVTGSITHGADRAAVVVARRAHWQGLGLDLEPLIPAARAERLIGELLTRAEQARCAHLPPDERALHVTLTFSLKESLFKALYPLVRQRFYFHDAELIAGPAAGQVRLRLLSDLSAAWRNGAELAGQYALTDGHLLSLVAIPA